MRKQMGFTLIELLVVVLIIGILAAVALPQYQKAVAKARATEAYVALGILKTSIQEYMMATGEFPVSYDVLSVVPEGTVGKYYVDNDKLTTKYYDIVLTPARSVDAGSQLRGSLPSFLLSTPLTSANSAFYSNGDFKIYCYYRERFAGYEKVDQICRGLSKKPSFTYSGDGVAYEL